MKKILKNLLFIISLILCLSSKVYAERYDGKIIPSEYIKGVYINEEKANSTTKKYITAQIIRRSTDNKFVYCLEPFVVVDSSKSYNFEKNDYLSVLSNLDNDKLQRAFLYAYYGYGYGNHTDDKWWAITQVLIWRTVDPASKFYFTKTLNGAKDDNKFASEIAELESLVNNHIIRPNLNIKNEFTMGESVTFTDSNNVLNNYTISSTNNISVTKSDNKLTITANAVGEGTITLTKSSSLYDENPVIYFSDASQNVFSVGNYDPTYVRYRVNVTGGKIILNKLDADTEENITSGEGRLNGAVYGLYDINDRLVQTLITDENGSAESDILPLGKYKLKELIAPLGYMIDTNSYNVELTKDNTIAEVNVYEEIINRDIQIHKYYANKHTGILVPESNVIFQFFDKENILVKQVVTDKDGIATFNLPYGTYKGKQLTTTPGYEKVEDFSVVINENSPDIIHLSFTNHPTTAKIKVIKKDVNSNLPILYEGTTFKIKDLDSNEYICQNVTYPKQENICEFKTNADGILILPEALVTGNYQLEEVKAPYGYLLNKNYLNFRIDDESEIVIDNEFGNYIELEYFNTNIKGEIVISKKGEFLNIIEEGFAYEEKVLGNIEFSLYADEDITTLDGVTHFKKGDLVATSVTNNKGKAIFSDLYLGKYIVKETKTLNNYILNESGIKVELVAKDDKNSLVSKTITLVNELKKGTLLFTKTDLVTGEVIPNTWIEIFTENEKKVFSDLTDDNGNIEIKDLSVGKYYIIEKEPVSGYVITDEKVYFEIKENKEIVKAEMTNKPIIGSLEFTKIDFSTSEPLPNTLMEFYKEDGTLIYSGYTNEEGKIILDELRYGKYYILEKEAPEGYEINSEKMYFEILEDGEFVKATMKDEKVKVPDTLTYDNKISEIVGGLFIVIGLGVLVYAKKKNK